MRACWLLFVGVLAKPLLFSPEPPLWASSFCLSNRHQLWFCCWCSVANKRVSTFKSPVMTDRYMCLSHPHSRCLLVLACSSSLHKSFNWTCSNPTASESLGFFSIFFSVLFFIATLLMLDVFLCVCRYTSVQSTWVDPVPSIPRPIGRRLVVGNPPFRHGMRWYPLWARWADHPGNA